MQKTTLSTDEDLRGIREPVGFKERQHFRVQQCVARIEAIVTAVLARQFDASQYDF